MWKIYLIEFFVVLIVSFVWVRAIDKMNNEHPDYKGEDFLNFEEDVKENNDNK